MRHQRYPQTAVSWFKSQADKLNNKATYKEKKDTPVITRDAVRPIFLSLSDEKLLGKCLQGKTQNNNESLNRLIYKRYPKDVIDGSTTLVLGVAFAVMSFNDGLGGAVKVIYNLHISTRKN